MPYLAHKSAPNTHRNSVQSHCSGLRPNCLLPLLLPLHSACSETFRPIFPFRHLNFSAVIQTWPRVQLPVLARVLSLRALMLVDWSGGGLPPAVAPSCISPAGVVHLPRLHRVRWGLRSVMFMFNSFPNLFSFAQVTSTFLPVRWMHGQLAVVIAETRLCH